MSRKGILGRRSAARHADITPRSLRRCAPAPVTNLREKILVHPSPKTNRRLEPFEQKANLRRLVLVEPKATLRNLVLAEQMAMMCRPCAQIARLQSPNNTLIRATIDLVLNRTNRAAHPFWKELKKRTTINHTPSPARECFHARIAGGSCLSARACAFTAESN